MPGHFVISLDFELNWGVRDLLPLEVYGANLLGVREVVPQTLDLFAEYGIHATWAVVGFLFFDGKEELIANLPVERPSYDSAVLSPYHDLDRVGASEAEDPLHFAPSLIERIARCPGQEIATHTFSHYYCLEPGQTIGQFESDLDMALRVARERGIAVNSLVLPRNQISPEYLATAARLGITCYRGNPEDPLWHSGTNTGTIPALLRRGLRLVDGYVGLTGPNTYQVRSIERTLPVNVRASRFLPPCQKGPRSLDGLRIGRVLRSMTRAAVSGGVYHLWWHPHNMGVKTPENITRLRRILDHFAGLRQGFGFQSRTMGEMAALVREGDAQHVW